MSVLWIKHAHTVFTSCEGIVCFDVQTGPGLLEFPNIVVGQFCMCQKTCTTYMPKEPNIPLIEEPSQHNWSFSPQSQTQHQALQACSLGSTAPGSWLSPKPPTLLVQTPDSANLVDHRHHLASGQALEACAAIVRDTSASRVESLGAGKTPRVMRHLVLSSGENIKCGEAVHFQHLLR